jgi:hypothetical protein
MTESDFATSLAAFPITGAAFSKCLSALFPADAMFEITDLETLTTRNSAALGDLWRRVGEAPVQISVRGLCDTLKNADQIVGLALRASKDPQSGLVIEDGEIVENTLFA